MWEVESMSAFDENGNYVTVLDDKITVGVRAKKKNTLIRKFKVKETPPCLSVAVADLIKLLAKEDTA